MSEASGADGKTGAASPGDGVFRFPQSRVRPPGSATGFNDLGPSLLSRQFGFPRRQATGHWCGRCRGIWYGYALEVTCPACGRRGG